jgi:hypothetical protein
MLLPLCSAIRPQVSEESGFIVASHTDMQKEILGNPTLYASHTHTHTHTHCSLKDAELLLHGPQYVWFYRTRRPFYTLSLLSSPTMSEEDRAHMDEDGIILGIMLPQFSNAAREDLVTWRRHIEATYPAILGARVRVRLEQHRDSGDSVSEWSDKIEDIPVFSAPRRDRDSD